MAQYGTGGSPMLLVQMSDTAIAEGE